METKEREEWAHEWEMTMGGQKPLLTEASRASKTPEYLEGRGRHGRMRRRDRKLWEHLVYLVSLYSLQNVKLKMTPLDAMKLMEYPEERYSVGIVVPSVAILRAVDGHQGLNEVVAC